MFELPGIELPSYRVPRPTMDAGAADGKAAMLANLATWVATTMPENGASMLADFLSQADEATRKSAAMKLRIADADARKRAIRMLQAGSAGMLQAGSAATAVESAAVTEGYATEATESTRKRHAGALQVDSVVAAVDSATETEDSATEATETTSKRHAGTLQAGSAAAAVESAAVTNDSATEATETTRKRHAGTLQAGVSVMPPKKRLQKVIVLGVRTHVVKQELGTSASAEGSSLMSSSYSGGVPLATMEDKNQAVQARVTSFVPSAISYASVLESRVPMGTPGAAASASTRTGSAASSVVKSAATTMHSTGSAPVLSMVESAASAPVSSAATIAKSVVATADSTGSAPVSSMVESAATIAKSVVATADSTGSAPTLPVINSMETNSATTTQTISTTTDLIAEIKTMMQPLFDRVRALEALQTREPGMSTSKKQANQDQAAGTGKADAALVSSNDKPTTVESIDTDEGGSSSTTSKGKTAKDPAADTVQRGSMAFHQSGNIDLPDSLNEHQRVQLVDKDVMVDDYVEDYLEVTPGAKTLFADIARDFRDKTGVGQMTFSDTRFFQALKKAIEEKGSAWNFVTKRNGRVHGGKGVLYDNVSFKKRARRLQSFMKKVRSVETVQRDSSTMSSKNKTMEDQAVDTAKTTKAQVTNATPSSSSSALSKKSTATPKTKPTKKHKPQIQLPLPLGDAIRYTRSPACNPRNIYFRYLEHSADELKGCLVLAQYFSSKNTTHFQNWYVGIIADVLPPQRSKAPPFDQDHAVRFEIAWGDEDPEGTIVTEHNILLIPSVLEYDLASDQFLPECVFFGSPEQVVVSWIKGCNLVMDLIDDLKEEKRDPKTFAGIDQVRSVRRGLSVNPPRRAKTLMMAEGAYNSRFSRDISQEDAHEMTRGAAMARQLAEMMDAATSSDSSSD